MASPQGPLQRERLCARCGRCIEGHSSATDEVLHVHRSCLLNGIDLGDSRRRPAVALPPTSKPVPCRVCGRLSSASRLVQVLLHVECFVACQRAMGAAAIERSRARAGRSESNRYLTSRNEVRCSRCSRPLRPDERCACRPSSPNLAPVPNCPACGRPVHPNGKCGCL
jgi:hypothetical protein